MSWLANFSSEKDATNQLLQSPAPMPEPGFFDGSGSAVVTGLGEAVVSLGAKTESTFLDGWTGIQSVMAGLVLPEPNGGWDEQDVTFEDRLHKQELEAQSVQAIRSLRPDPAQVGLLGQVLHPAANYGAQAAIGAFAGNGLAAMRGAMSAITAGKVGAVASVGLTEQNTSQMMGEADGLDSATAETKSWIDGSAAALGVALPISRILPNKLLDLGASFTANVGVGVGSRYANSELLRANGYDDMADQYQALDAMAVTTDAVLWAAFRTGAAIGDRYYPPQELVDAALTEKNARRYEQAPLGLPANPESMNAHTAGMDRVAEQLARGQTVDIGTVLEGATFVPRPDVQSPIQEAVREAYPDALPAADRWAPSQDLTGIPLEQRRALPYDAPELNGYAAAIEQQMGLPAGLLNAIKNAGERSNSDQVSPAGARGVMQFMPENLRKFGVTDATDPVQIIEAAGRYFTKTSRQYGGNIDAMIADYNGGPRQAREVLAGRQPKAKETRDYLKRVRAELGRDVPSRDMPLARTPDEFPLIPAEQAGYAKALEEEIQSVEVTREDLMTVVSGMADLGEVTRVRAEISPLTERRQQLDAVNATRDIAKEIQAAKPRTSYKQALAQAETQRVAEVADLDARIGRLEGFLQKNTEANQAAQQLAQLDEQITLLRDNRAAIEVPPVADVVRSAIESMPALARADSPAATSQLVDVADAGAVASTMPSRRLAVASADAPSLLQDEAALLRQLVAEDPDALIFGGTGEDGSPITSRLSDVLADIEQELEFRTKESSAFSVAANCYLRKG